jgi:hypothetical protein
VITAQTASFVILAQTASLATRASGSLTGSLLGTAATASFVTTAQTASYVLNAVSSSFASTASYVAGTVQNAINAQSGSNFVVTNTLVIDEALIDFAKVNSTIVGSNNLFQQATGSRTSAHGKYTLYKGTDARAGEFVTVWNGTSTEYYDNSTKDIGNTTDITFQSSIVTGQIQINAVAATSGWTVKMITTYL